MNSDQINKELKNIKMFHGTFPRDDLPLVSNRPCSMISNTDGRNGPGEHWVALLLLDGGKGEYFDPFGIPVLHQDLATYMDRACPKGWSWNNVTIQSADDSSCGSWCIQYLRARSAGFSLVDFLLLMSEHLFKNHF